MLSDLELLKIELSVNGMNVSETARKELQGPTNKSLSTADYATTSGIPLCIKDGKREIWVNSPIPNNNPNFVKNPKNTLNFKNGTFMVSSKKQEVEVSPVRVPDYYNRKAKSGEPFRNLATCHTDRVRIAPIQGCAINCEFCDWGAMRNYQKKNIDDLIEGIQAAFDDPTTPAKHIMISGGTPNRKDYPYLNDVYERVASAFPKSSVDVMMAPMPGLIDVQHLKDVGIEALFINLEMHDKELLRRMAKTKYYLGRETYLKFIEDAYDVFGEGKIRSLLLVGIESMENTLKGVRELASRGCDPILSTFIPDPTTPMRNVPPPTAKFLAETYEKSKEIVDKYQGVKLGPRCIPCHHNTLTFDDGSGKYYHSH